MSPLEVQNELDWQALQYVAGDLDVAASAQFELRLAIDQAAREAVARAVELTQVIVAAESQAAQHLFLQHEFVTPPESVSAFHASHASNWGTRLVWMAIGGLLSLLVGVLATSGMFSRQPATSTGSGELAQAWSETRLELTTADAENIGPLHPISLAFSDNDEESDVQGNSLLLVDTPSWMTTAVVGLAGQGSGGSPAGGEPDDEESGVN